MTEYLKFMRLSCLVSPPFCWAVAISAILHFDSASAAEKQLFDAQAAELTGGASKVSDGVVVGGYLAGLASSGQGVKFCGLPAASKIAIRYASTNVGTISVAVDGQPPRKINVHSSGALTNSFLHAVIELAIPAMASLTISVATNDVVVNIDHIVVGDGDLGLPPDIWNLPPLPVASGPYPADWTKLSRAYTVPEWWRDAKFGAWSHWDPQSMPEQGDWYARGMYLEGNRQYNHHLQNFGHPSEYGYKDICHNWVIDRWNPNELMDLYVEMGARYFMAMGVHHDNFDCWDSAYQPWNSVRVGPKVDVVGTWEKLARGHGLRFGIGFHNTPPRTWGQFMTVRYTSDKRGAKPGVPYDARHTILDGKGEWWEGLDPVDLYGPPHSLARGPRRPEDDALLSPFGNQFMWRVDDAITKYHPDVIYFDEHAGDSQVDLGVHMGLGFLAPQLAANYYNKSLQWNDGQMEAVLNLKGVGGRYNSFQHSPELLPHVDRSLVKSTEAVIEPEIMAYSFQTETTIAPWHYQTGQRYMNANAVVGLLMENVSRNGTMLLNITQHGRGDLDPEAVRICKDIGAWLKVSGEAVYGSRPFESLWRSFDSLHAQPGPRLCHGTGLDQPPDHPQSAADRRGDPRQSVQSQIARFRCAHDVCSRRTRADRDAGWNRATAAGNHEPVTGISLSRPAHHSRPGLDQRRRSRRPVCGMDSPLQPGHWRFQQRPDNQRNARRCLDLFVHRNGSFRDRSEGNRRRKNRDSN
jgi:alpha-L-fucosidase